MTCLCGLCIRAVAWGKRIRFEILVVDRAIETGAQQSPATVMFRCFEIYCLLSRWEVGHINHFAQN